MYSSFLFLHMMEKYNYFQGIDKYFRELGKVFLELKNEGVNYPANNYQNLLNSEFYIETQKPKTYVENMSFDYEKVSNIFE